MIQEFKQITQLTACNKFGKVILLAETLCHAERQIISVMRYQYICTIQVTITPSLETLTVCDFLYASISVPWTLIFVPYTLTSWALIWAGAGALVGSLFSHRDLPSLGTCDLYNLLLLSLA